MEKDILRIQKNPETEIVLRLDDFGGTPGLTIREFVKSERYTGFTKAGVRIKAEKFEEFKNAINAIDTADFKTDAPASKPEPATEPKQTDSEDAGIDESGLM
jgi:hypothetical protein